MPDRIVPGAPGEPVDLWIYSASPKLQWYPRSRGDFTRAEHPGSAIKYGDKLYEVMSAEETGQWGYNIRYGLREWDSAHVVRTYVSYTPEAEAAVEAVERAEARKLELRNRIVWFFPLAGAAPDLIQNKWGELAGINMAWVAAGSATFGMGLAFLLRGVTENTRLYDLVLYLAFESFARLLWTALSRRPHGSFLLTVPYYLWLVVTHLQTGASQDAAPTLPPIKHDEVIRRPGESALRVRSMFFDTDLAGTLPVRFEDALYKPLRWRLEGKGLQRRWVYELERIEAAPAGRWREFTNPRSPTRQKAVEAFTHNFDLANSFALFWGIYPRRDQVRLQLLYGYEGAKSTALSAGIFLAVGLLQLFLTVASRLPSLALAGPAYLILESAYRLYRAKGLHEPTGSIVGYIFRLAIHAPK
jgi:hypothetical protein